MGEEYSESDLTSHHRTRTLTGLSASAMFCCFALFLRQGAGGCLRTKVELGTAQ